MPILEKVLHWVTLPVADNPLWLWGATFLVFLFSVFVLIKIRGVFARRFRKLEPEGKKRWAGLVAALFEKTHGLFLTALALLGSTMLLELGQRADGLRKVLVVISLLQGGFWSVAIMNGLLVWWKERRGSDGSAATGIIAMGFLGQTLIWTTVLLLALDNLGVKVTALLAGLGVGGIAAALAVQNILGDLFASVSILLDKPFEIGDYIVVGDLMGTVENIGLKTTRVRSHSGEQVVFSNSDLLSSRIRNFKRMFERRVSLSIGVRTDTPYAKLEELPALLRTMIEGREHLRFDRAHLMKIGDAAIHFDIVFYVTKPDETAWMDAQQAINLAILKKLPEAGILLAFK